MRGGYSNLPIKATNVFDLHISNCYVLNMLSN